MVGGKGGGIQKDDSKRFSVGAENRNPCKFLYTGTRFQTFSNSLFILIIFLLLPSPAYRQQNKVNLSSNIRQFFMICDVNHLQRKRSFFYEELCECLVENDDFILNMYSILGIST